ncbi:MAG TPA: bifunctional hydroxymethylpyrimidine kinase/phosphomethylpyrimidine kinase [Candidatus Baltobacteraceae bacterium]|nr:bifunctional hydroxymethylpyrimidine kinase/phosphomethylpyrimidine kinase [Candidatus Baltobacteraceae bacterium]
MPALVASIGTTHPRNVAGLGLDARIAADYGLRHAIALAAVSAQDEHGVHDLFAIPPGVLRAQLAAIPFSEVAAVRVGALGSLENAQIAAEFLQAHCSAPAVFDPVMRASAGGSLYAGDALEAVRAFALRAGAILTPNLEEASQLTQIEIRDVDGMIAAGRQLLELGARAVLVKGGHLAGDPVDVLVTREGAQTFSDTRLPGKTRGTGCTLAMGVACELARGENLLQAVRGARAYVRANIARP